MPRARSTNPSPLKPKPRPNPKTKSTDPRAGDRLSFDEFIDDLDSLPTSPGSSIRTPNTPPLADPGLNGSAGGSKGAAAVFVHPATSASTQAGVNGGHGGAGGSSARARARAARAANQVGPSSQDRTQAQIDLATQDARDFPGFEGYGHTTWCDATGEMTSSVTHYGGRKATVAQIKELVAIMNAPGMNADKCMELVRQPSRWADLYAQHHKYIHLLANPLDEYDTFNETLPGFTRAYFYPGDDWRNLKMPGVPTIDSLTPPKRPELLCEFGFDPEANQRVLVNVNYAVTHPCDDCTADDLACFTGLQDICHEANDAWTWYRPACEACHADEVECSAVGRWRKVDGQVEHYDRKAAAPQVPSDC